MATNQTKQVQEKSEAIDMLTWRVNRLQAGKREESVHRDLLRRMH